MLARRSLVRSVGHVPVAALLAFAAFVATGCGASTQAPPATPTRVQNASASVPAKANATPTASNVVVSPDILRACGLPDADAYFTYDSSQVTSTDRSPLDAVAKCFTSGPLAGRSLKLVGRADPRGSTEYNMTLGQSRADAVASYLEARGVGAGRASSTSRGAMDAIGTNEASWARDRRVD